MKRNNWKSILFGFVFMAGFTITANATSGHSNGSFGCSNLPSHSQLKAALDLAVAESNGGFGFNMWATLVDRDGKVCQVAMSGGNRGDQWPGSRVISAQKANTANAFTLPGFALATANLWAATQPGGSLFGLQLSNPVDTAVAYGNGHAHGGGSAKKYGTSNDPMRGKYIGGINVFGGGLGMYKENSILVGGLGVSGDTSCADHNIAWRVRETLAGFGSLHVPAGVSSNSLDQIIYDINPSTGKSAGGFGHPACRPGNPAAAAGGAAVE